MFARFPLHAMRSDDRHMRLADWWPADADPVVVFEMPGELTLMPLGWTCVKRLGKGARQPTTAFFRRS